MNPTLLRFSRPPMTRSTAASKSTMEMKSLAPRAAISAASLHTFAMSAPANPGDSAARRSLREVKKTISQYHIILQSSQAGLGRWCDNASLDRSMQHVKGRSVTECATAVLMSHLKYSTGRSSFSLARWMRKMASRPVMSGRSIEICRSNLQPRTHPPS